MSSDGLLVVKESKDQWVWLDIDGRPVRKVDLLVESANASGTLGGILAWALGDGEILAFADIKLADTSWQSGFVRIPVDSPAEFEMLYPTALDSPATLFYRYGQNFVTWVGATGYFLAMEEHPGIFEVSSGRVNSPRRLRSFPGPREDLAFRPHLPQTEGVGAARQLADAMEGSTGVVGIFGGRQLLHVLAREVAPHSNAVGWSLLQIDPLRDRYLGSFTLPTSAPHILVIPGPQYWAFVEKGRVRKLGEQETESILLIPSAWIEDPNSARGLLQVTDAR